MKRTLTIVEGAGKGASFGLTPGLFIVGRSSDADFRLEDNAVSRGHLQIRVEGNAVFVKNISTKGSALNDGRLMGEASLNAGDTLTLGDTTICYEEGAGAQEIAEVPVVPEYDLSQPESDGTRVAPTRAYADQSDDENAGGHTVAWGGGDDETRFADPDQLPTPPPPRRRGAGILWVMFFFVSVLGVTWGYFWFEQQRVAKNVGVSGYSDPGFDFAFDYPSDWAKSSDTPGEVTLRFGTEADAEWAQVKVRFARDEKHMIAGITLGFSEYAEQLRERLPEAKIESQKRMRINDATVVFFRFQNSGVSGAGIFLLNAERQFSVECFSPHSCIARFESPFKNILRSFRMTSVIQGEPQVYIDYPPPSEMMKNRALADPDGLKEEVAAKLLLAEVLVDERNARPDNLYRAKQQCREALQFAIAGPEPMAAYVQAARKLLEATKLLNTELKNQQFEIQRALKTRDAYRARTAAGRIMQMLPDKTDQIYQDAKETLKRFASDNR